MLPGGSAAHSTRQRACAGCAFPCIPPRIRPTSPLPVPCTGGAARQGLLRGRPGHGDQAAGGEPPVEGSSRQPARRLQHGWANQVQRSCQRRCSTPTCQALLFACQPGSMASAPGVKLSCTDVDALHPTSGVGGAHGGGHKGPRPGAARPALAAAGRPHLLHRHVGAFEGPCPRAAAETICSCFLWLCLVQPWLRSCCWRCADCSGLPWRPACQSPLLYVCSCCCVCCCGCIRSSCLP